MTTHTATLLLVIASACGGSSSVSPDVATGDGCDRTVPWAAGPELPMGPVQEMATVATGGKIYVLGGFRIGLSNVVLVLDTTACSWSQGPDLPKDIHHPNATVLDGTIYIVGGLQGGGGYTAIGDTWSWNPARDDAWSVLEPMPAGTQRGAAVAGVIDGKIYVAGGLRNMAATTDVSYFDPAANTWTAAPPLPQPRDHASGGVIDGKLYVACGRNINPGAPFANVFELTPGGGWTDRAPCPTPRSGSAYGVIDDRLIVAGGEGNPAAGSRGVFPQAEAFDPRQNTWQTLAPMPTPRHGVSAAAWNGRLYVPGGADQQGAGAVTTLEILTPWPL